MLQKTKHSGLHQSIHALIWRYIVDHLYLNRDELAGKWTLDHLELRFKSICGNVGSFVFTNDNFFKHAPNLAKISMRLLIHCYDLY